MKFPPYLALVLFALNVGIASGQTKCKAIFVIADGIPADVIERVSTPALDSIAKIGGYSRAYVGGIKDSYSETPTISAVGYNSLLTGTWVNKHHVYDNDGPGIDSANYHYYNIFRLFKQQYPQKRTAIFSTWEDNRTKLIGSAKPEAGSLQPDIVFDGMELDTSKYPHDNSGYFYHLIDDAVADSAASNIRRNAPDLSWVYLEYTDEMGHRHGNGENMDRAVEMMDRQIEKIWKAIQFRTQQWGEDWEIFITTDHGRKTDGYGHGGQSPRERTTWIVTNAKNLNLRFRNDTPAIVDIMPSLARFLDIRIEPDRLREIDGVPLTGKISVSDARATLHNDMISLTWNVFDKNGVAKVYMATTNKFATGGTDQYQLIKTVKVAEGKTEIDVKGIRSQFFKLVIEAPGNMINTWVE